MCIGTSARQVRTTIKDLTQLEVLVLAGNYMQNIKIHYLMPRSICANTSNWVDQYLLIHPAGVGFSYLSPSQKFKFGLFFY